MNDSQKNHKKKHRPFGSWFEKIICGSYSKHHLILWFNIFVGKLHPERRILRATFRNQPVFPIRQSFEATTHLWQTWL